MSYHQTLLNIITRAKEQLFLIESLDFNRKTNPKSWSKKEILGHLIDSGYNNYRRFLLATQQDNLIFDGYEQDNWVAQNQYQNRDYKELIDIWFLTNKQIYYLIKNIPSALLNNKTTEHNFHKICSNRLEEGEAASLDYLIWDYIFHLEHHLGQIIENYQKLNKNSKQNG